MNKKEQIILSARNLFTKFGYKKVSMDEIAHDAGVTKRTVYSYFKDKKELFEYFITEELLKMKKKLEKIEKEEPDTITAFHKMIYELIKYKKESNLFDLISREAEIFKSEEAISFTNKIDNEIIGYIKEKIVVKMDEGKIKKLDADLCAFIVYTIYKNILLNYSSQNLNEKEISENIMTILKDGLIN